MERQPAAITVLLDDLEIVLSVAEKARDLPMTAWAVPMPYEARSITRLREEVVSYKAYVEQEKRNGSARTET